MDGVALKGVSCRHADGTLALDEVTLRIAAGERFGLLGPSGSGKTTLLRVVAGLTPSTDGGVELGGRDVSGLSPGERGVGYVAQDAPLLPFLDVGGNLAFGPRVRHDPPEQVRSIVGRVAATLGLEQLLSRRPRELSHGARREVALGRATASDARVLLLDEPFAGLDAAERRKVLDALLRHHAATRATVLLATHDETDLWRFADRVGVLIEGSLRQIGSMPELHGEPADVEVATLVGSPPMHLLPADVELVGQGGGAVRIAGQRVWFPTLPPAVRAAEGATVTLGVRGARLATTTGTGPRLHGQLRGLHRLGSHNELQVRAGDVDLHVHAPAAASPAPGAVVEVELDPQRCRWFDALSGRAL